MRWYPANKSVWQSISKNKFGVIRYEMLDDGNINNKATPVQFEPFGFNIESVSNKKDSLAEFVLGCLQSNASGSNISEIIATINSEESCMAFSMLLLQQNFDLTLQFGMGFFDPTASKNKFYYYRIFQINSPFSDTFDIPIYDSEPKMQMGPPSLISKAEGIEIHWNKNEIPENICGFYIEKRKYPFAHWISITEKPIYKDVVLTSNTENSVYWDNDVVPDSNYEYRFIPVNYFGDQLLSSQSSRVIAVGINPSSPQNLYIENGLIYWSFPASSENNIEGFDVYTSDSLMDGYKPLNSIIIEKTQRSFGVPNFPNSQYIKVIARSNKGEFAVSDALFTQSVDSIPPESPNIVYSQIDSLGIVILRWRKNPERDHLGYQIYRSNSRFTEFSNISPQWIADTTFQDTLDINWQRDSIYYYVLGSDLRYNQSKASLPIALKLPSFFVPDAPIIFQLTQQKPGLILGCVGSNADVLHYEIYKKEGKFDWILYKTLPGNLKKEFNDTDVHIAKNLNYSYKIRAKNSHGTYSKFSPEMGIITEGSQTLESISGFKIWIDSATRKTYFSWNKPKSTLHHYRIIDKTPGKVHTIATVGGDKTELVLPYIYTSEFKNIIIIGYNTEGERTTW
ncbi:MAG: hypothetical protein IT244_02980 [Bacteroidia bacterium]|nr:hypothetical protein [Bacteroidia bacterium]